MLEAGCLKDPFTFHGPGVEALPRYEPADELSGPLKRAPVSHCVCEERRDALRGLNRLLRPRTAQLGALATLGSQKLTVGSSVQLRRLRSRAELNGTCGEVVDQQCDKHGQLLVRLFPEGAHAVR